MKIKVQALNGAREFEDDLSQEHEALLDVVEKQGLKLPYGCRAGSCGVCRVKLKGDLDQLLPRGIVEEDTALRCHDEENIRLACQLRSKPGAQGVLSVEIAPEAVIPDSE